MAQRSGPYGGTRRVHAKADEARDFLTNLLFSHVPVVRFNFQEKVRLHPSAP